MHFHHFINSKIYQNFSQTKFYPNLILILLCITLINCTKKLKYQSNWKTIEHITIVWVINLSSLRVFHWGCWFGNFFLCTLSSKFDHFQTKYRTLKFAIFCRFCGENTIQSASPSNEYMRCERIVYAFTSH